MPFSRTVTIKGSTDIGVSSGVLVLQPGPDISNFPVRFAGVFSFLRTVANGGKVQSNTGLDIFFTSDAAGLVRLAFERVAYNAVTGAVEFYINLPSLFGAQGTATDNVIYIWYGQNNAVDLSDRTGTWNSQYVAVYHFGDGTTLDLTDSTANHNDGAAVNAPTAAGGLLPDATGNFTGGAVSLQNALAQLISVGASSSLNIPGSPGLVLMAAAKASSSAGAGADRGIFGNLGINTIGFGLFQHRNTNPFNQPGVTVDNSPAGVSTGAGPDMSAGNVVFLIAIMNPNDASIELQISVWNTSNNTISRGTVGVTAGTLGNGSTLQIGKGYNLWDNFDGLVDEARILNTPAGFPFNVPNNGVDRINVEFNNLFQNSSFPFYHVGAEASTATLAGTCTNPANGSVGFGYFATLAATGGFPPYTFAVTAGALPPGLSLNPAGTISGVPTLAGTFTFTVTITDSQSATAICVNLSITITSGGGGGNSLEITLYGVKRLSRENAPEREPCKDPPKIKLWEVGDC